MTLAALVSLALLAAQSDTPFQMAPETPPPAEQPAPGSSAETPPAPEAPAADPAPPPRPASEALSTGRTTADSEVQANAVAAGEPFPPGAPTDDYGLMGWCLGALSRHAELRDVVWPEVERIEKTYPGETPWPVIVSEYDAQKRDGVAVVKRLGKAMDALQASGQNGGQDRAVVIETGRAVWTGADTVPVRTVAQQWMQWSLPGRCTTTANRIMGGAAPATLTN